MPPPDKVRLILHLPGSVLREPSKIKPYYRRIIEGFEKRGGVVETVIHDRAIAADQVAADTNFHIIDHGRLRHPRVLNTGIAYIYPFWNLDPWGVRASSSISALDFLPEEIDAGAASSFHNRLVRRLVETRTSRHPQPAAISVLPENCIAVFLQSEGHRPVEETCYLSRKQMIAALLARDDPRPVVVKPHPADIDATTADWLHHLAKADRRLKVTRGNIHDILDAASVTVTINSAVAVESMLHSIPVVLCGRADFHHACETATTGAQLDSAIASAERRDWAFAKYLYWYFAMNCINAGSPDVGADVLKRIAATGFDIARFGFSDHGK